MCPECIPTLAMITAGASSIGSLSLLFITNLARPIRKSYIPIQRREVVMTSGTIERPKVVTRED